METLASLRAGLASGRLHRCESLKLSDNLKEFPMEILAFAESLTFLNLSDNHLSELPAEFSQLKKLEIVFFNNNNFQDFPRVLAQCPRISMVSFKNNTIENIHPEALSHTIRWLILTNNRLTSLPATLGSLPKLQKLMLAGNQLTSIPDTLINCARLELIRLSANQLTTLPQWLTRLPRLSWLAYAGNPCCPAQPAVTDAAKLPVISDRTLQPGKILGQGASGVIYKGVWDKSVRDNDVRDSAGLSAQPAAIKLFKGDITSDGSPLDEMQACIAAGNHPNLVSVLGKYQGNHQSGLVFSFIPSGYTNLGGPPSLETCTRDTYAEGTVFGLSEVLKIARGIAAAMAHLHDRGIMHGDLYAHNILVNADGHSILGDFGAASFYAVAAEGVEHEQSTAVGNSLERLEVRAFGCLLEDLLDRCANCLSPKIEQLRQLQHDCMLLDLTQRPCFKSICDIL